MDQPNPPRHPDHVTASEPTPATAAEEAPIPSAAPPLSARGWLAQNGPWLVVLGAIFTFAYVKLGPQGFVQGLLAVLGLGFVIFIHELGHFLAAKWCDVHVLTFSIGFGPALPGCSFTRGETTYKLALLPLGGYVNMVGEGPEADEEEDYPRSFKNKSVGARMLIISAGVIMNVLLGAVCFITVYRYMGAEDESAVLWRIEPGARAWQAGVRSGWKVAKINDTVDPTFTEMKRTVALSPANKPLEFTFVDRQGKTHERLIEPLRDENAQHPVIGVTAAPRLSLVGERYRKLFGTAVKQKSAASYARVLPLARGDVVLKASDPEDPAKLTPLPEGEKGWLELARRLERADKSPLKLEVARGGDKAKSETIDVPAVGFDFGDRIVGTTDPATPDQPFNLSPLPLDPEHPAEMDLHDLFAFRGRMTTLAGRAVVIQVRRENDGPDATPQSLFVPPAYHVTLGLEMKMGKVAAVRPNAPAEKAGLKGGYAGGDVITGVSVSYDKGKAEDLTSQEMDPVRLPYSLYRRVHAPGKDVNKWEVILKVRRLQNHDSNNEETLKPMEWDNSYALEDEEAVSAGAPMSIPQLGLAYWVESEVREVKPGGPADKAGVLAGDTVTGFRYRVPGVPGEKGWRDGWKMSSERGKEKEVYDRWGRYFAWMQVVDPPVIRLTVKRAGSATSGKPPELPQSEDKNAGMEPVIDSSWPLAERGLSLDRDTRIKKADSLRAAVAMGLDETASMIRLQYQSIARIFSGRISPETMGGPIEILTQASRAAANLSLFVLLMGVISIGLAVVNFLPIPVLDGGHMVFLIYEKLRGKPPSESVRVVSTYIGLALILMLMCYVFWNDFLRHDIWKSVKGLFGGG